MSLNLTNETLSLQFYMCVVIANFGILTNAFNIIVSSRSKIQEIAVMGFYNICMSCLNILALLVFSYLYIFSQSIGRAELISTSLYACLAIPFFSRVFSTMTSWVNVLVSYDCICAFKVNYNRHFLHNRNNLKKILFLIFLISCFAQMFNLFFYLETQTQYDSTKNATQIITVCTAPKIILSLRDVFAALARIILPIIFQTIFNGILIVKLFEFRKKRDLTLKKEKRLAFTVIIFNIIYVLGEMPLIVCSVFINIYGYNQTYISTSSNESAIASFAYVCSLAFVIFTSYSLLPFVNYFTNKIYKKETKKMLGLKV
jgi:hypothetical protein